MPTTKQMVDDNIALVDGTPSTDPLVIRRWTRAVQRAVNFVWNDRPWAFKLVEDDAFSFSTAAGTTLPSDFGSVESEGAGVYSLSPKAPCKPMSRGEILMAQKGLQLQTMGFGPWTRWGEDGLKLYLWPVPTTIPQTIGFHYLKRKPTCVYEATPSADQLSWIPEQWHDLISDGARWMNLHDVNSAQETTEQAFTKLGLDQMRDRTTQLGQSSIVPFMRRRRNR